MTTNEHKEVMEALNSVVEFMSEKFDKLDNKIDNVHDKLDKKIDNVHDKLDKKIDNVHSELSQEIKRVEANLRQDIHAVNQRLDDSEREFSDADGVSVLEELDKHDKRIRRLEKKLA